VDLWTVDIVNLHEVVQKIADPKNNACIFCSRVVLDILSEIWNIKRKRRE